MILLTDEEIAKNWIPLNQIREPKDMVWLEGKAIAQAQLKKVLNAFMILGGDGGNPNNPHPFHYAISRDVYLQWLKECEE